MKSLNSNLLNRKRQNGICNPCFLLSKEFTPNGFSWFDSEDQDTSEIFIELDLNNFI